MNQLKQYWHTPKKLKTILMDRIELVSFSDTDKPVVYLKKVYQLCVLDGDYDCIMKDTINGVQIIHNVFSGVNYYDLQLIEVLNDHPFNGVKQIKVDNHIIGGTTETLQLLVDKYYDDHQ